MIEVTEILKIVGFFMSLSAVLWGVVKWLLARIDSHRIETQRYVDTKHQTAMSSINRLDGQLDEVKNDYVRRRDLDRDFIALDKRLEATEKAIAEGRAETNQRLDRMLMLLGKVISNTQHQDLD